MKRVLIWSNFLLVSAAFVAFYACRSMNPLLVGPPGLEPVAGENLKVLSPSAADSSGAGVARIFEASQIPIRRTR